MCKKIKDHFILRLKLFKDCFNPDYARLKTLRVKKNFRIKFKGQLIDGLSIVFQKIFFLDNLRCYH